MAHLHYRGKGANKTPPECVASDLPKAGGDRSFRRRTGPTGGGLQRGWGNRQDVKRVEAVTSNLNGGAHAP